VTDIIQAALAAGVERFRRHADAIPTSDDLEDVHQARVATRRLRSDLHTFAPLLDGEWVSALRAELKWLGEMLGAVRDDDVLGERLRRQVEELPESDRRDADGILSRLASQRADHVAGLIEALGTQRCVNIVTALEAAAAVPGPPVDVALVRRPWKRLHKAVGELGEDPRDEELHEIRKRAKQCRYALEAVTPDVGDDAARWAKAVAGLQTVLGDLNDAVGAEAWLRAGDATFLSGVLIGIERGEAAASRAAWPAAWKRASKKRLRAWL
jgi:CHAD domain-containing protein